MLPGEPEIVGARFAAVGWVTSILNAGKVVLTSDRDPMRSRAGDAALLVDPENVEAIAAGVLRLLSDSELRGYCSDIMDDEPDDPSRSAGTG